jgi:ribosomal protein L37AE/L43A
MSRTPATATVVVPEKGVMQMSHVDCPHCGARNFTLLDQVELDRCRDCGRSLAAESELAEVSARAALAHRGLARSRGLGNGPDWRKQ